MSRPLRIGPAAVDSLANEAADIDRSIALSIEVPTGRSWPAWTARVSVAAVPWTSLATVSISVAPSLTVITALNEPSGASVAWTSLTSTLSSASPAALGSAWPLTVTWPACPWISPRAGEVTVRTGGSLGAPGPFSQAAMAVRTARPVARATRFRMAAPFVSKRRAITDGASGHDQAHVDRIG